MRLFGRTQHMGAAALIMAFSILLSRFAGLLRDKVISWNFGAGADADIYFSAFVIPDFLNYLLAGGYFSITLIPLLTERFERDSNDAWRFFSAVFWWIALATLVLTGFAWLAAPQLAAWTAPGFAHDPAKFSALITAIRTILPAQCFFLPGACLTALLYMRRQFTAPALAPLVYNASIILFGLLGLALGLKGMTGFYWGVVIGAAVGSFLLPLLAARSGGLTLLPILRHPGLRQFILLALPLMLGQSIMVLDEQFVRVFGSMTGEGAVSLLNYARRLMLVPVAVVAQAAGVASYPFLASLAAAGQRVEFDSTLSLALKNSLSVILPITVWMIVAAEPAIQLIYLGGGFTLASAHIAGALLRAMMLGVGFWAVQQVMGRAFYAHKNTLAPVVIGTLGTLTALPVYYLATRPGPLLNALARLLPPDIPASTLGIALAGVFGVALYTLGLAAYWQHRYQGNALAGTGRHILLCLLLCLPAAIVAWLITTILPAHLSLHPVLTAFINLAASGTAFALIVLLLGFLLFPQALPSMLRRKR